MEAIGGLAGPTAENDGSTNPPTTLLTSLQEQLAPALSCLVPALPQIPHILTGLCTLATLHASMAQFTNSLYGLEEQQQDYLLIISIDLYFIGLIVKL